MRKFSEPYVNADGECVVDVTYTVVSHIYYYTMTYDEWIEYLWKKL